MSEVDPQQAIHVQLSLQEVSVVLALLDILAAEDLSPDVAGLATESQRLLRARAEEAKAAAG